MPESRVERRMGEPDAIFGPPDPIPVQAEGQMPYVHIRVPTDFPEDRWVQSLEIQPEAAEVVHHVLVFALPPPDPQRPPLDPLRERISERDGFFAAYVPGAEMVQYPEGYAKRLPQGASLLFQLHYTPDGRTRVDRTRLGLRFAKEKPRYAVHTVGIANPRLAIPAGVEAHEEKAGIPVPTDVVLLGLSPHLHLRGKSFRFELVAPGGERRTLLDVPRYDFNWQLTYKLREPLALAKGSRIDVTAVFDNSKGNPANPNAEVPVRWGPQSTDEMLIGYVEYFVADPEADGPRTEAIPSIAPSPGCRTGIHSSAIALRFLSAIWAARPNLRFPTSCNRLRTIRPRFDATP